MIFIFGENAFTLNLSWSNVLHYKHGYIDPKLFSIVIASYFMLEKSVLVFVCIRKVVLKSIVVTFPTKQ